MKRVVIIGGGFAGSLVAQQLERDAQFSVTLIDTKDYFEFTPGILRTIVAPQHMRKIQKKHTDYLHATQFVRGTVSEVQKDHVIVEKNKIPFDFLVIASGSAYREPIKEADIILATRAQHLHEAYHSVEDAQNILIIGGGLVGVELAAEIVTHYPGKHIDLVHSGDALIERNPVKAQHYALQFLQKKGVHVHFHEFISNYKDHVFCSKNGTTYKPDVVFSCTGIVPNSSFMKRHFSLVLDDRGFIRVTDSLEVKGHMNIFAIGDVNALSVEKTAQHAGKQGKCVVKNIRAQIAGRPLKTYSSKPLPIIISLGTHDGLFISGSYVCGGILCALAKWVVEKKEMWLK